MPQPDRRMLTLLERLFEIPPAALDVVLSRSADIITEPTPCEKVDVLLHELDSHCLVAIGTAHTELAQLQKSLGLDRLPIANLRSAARSGWLGARRSSAELASASRDRDDPAE